jgi:hypothetical protein
MRKPKLKIVEPPDLMLESPSPDDKRLPRPRGRALKASKPNWREEAQLKRTRDLGGLVPDIHNCPHCKKAVRECECGDRYIKVAVGKKPEVSAPSSSKNHWIATIHGGMWEIHEYSPKMLEAIRRVDREHPGEFKLLGIFPTRIEAIEICRRHVSPEENAKRNKETIDLLGQLAELRRKREKEL